MAASAAIQTVDLVKHFRVRTGLFSSGIVHAVDGVSITVPKGHTFGLVGESGCGKSTIARLILALERPTSGTIAIDHGASSDSTDSEYSHGVQAVFQDPFSSLSPRMRVKDAIAEPLRVRGLASGSAIDARVQEVLALVGLAPNAGSLYPHQFSGGQRQRIAIARALSVRPRTIVLDEPFSALDVSIRAQIVNLLMDLQQRLGLAYLLITHDLSVGQHMSNRIGVMYLGKLVEEGPSASTFTEPLHPYTKLLLSAVPIPDPDAPKPAIAKGEVPSPINPPSGCRFHTRCPEVMPVCSTAEPAWRETRPDHYVACHLY